MSFCQDIYMTKLGYLTQVLDWVQTLSLGQDIHVIELGCLAKVLGWV